MSGRSFLQRIDRYAPFCRSQIPAVIEHLLIRINALIAASNLLAKQRTSDKLAETWALAEAIANGRKS
jgi:hypothetical protein